MNDTIPDEKLFDQLRKWLVEQGFHVEDTHKTVIVDEDLLVNPTETLTMKWRVTHPKDPETTECFIYEELWEQYREVMNTDDHLSTAKSIFKWMIDFYDLCEKD